MVPPVRDITAQGYDLQFGTNVLGHFYLTKLLLPALLDGSKSSPDGWARVVNTSSAMAGLGKKINFDTLTDTPERKKQIAWQLYGQSKLGNVLFSDELARRYGHDGIISISLNPGNLRTELGRSLSKFEAAVIYPVLHPVHLGALTQLWAGTSPEAVSMNGKYLVPWARVGKTRPGGDDSSKLSGELWTWMDNQVSNF
ncbi:hypothetical protein D9619_013521 [Psilocybe cf. subviscida]|uniref:NAD(P)-binding protein n=1 Tax=Psilocybe cf. subviscida TaxID=2480587 RepID=A0A8H5BJF0_9AGAR|nr:hypothetical protein D9619_013521 [Psilocybe cf. subviscida]